MAIQDGSPTTVWGSLLGTTIMNYMESGSLRDQVHNRSPFWKWLRSGNRIRKVSGGERIKVPQMYAGSGNYKRYANYEVFDVTPYDGQTQAHFDWKQAATAVVISGLEKRNNQGEFQIRSLIKDRIFQAEASLGDGLATDAYSDGTADGSKQITGLAAMVATTNTSGTYAGINSLNNTTWRNNVSTSVGSAATNLVPALKTVYNDCTEIAGVDGEPDAIFTTQTIAEALESLVTPAIRYMGGQEADLSAKPTFRGAKIFWEAKCQSGMMYVLNSKHIFMFVHKDADMTPSAEGMRSPINQDAFVMPILYQGNLATNLRSALGKLTGIT